MESTSTAKSRLGLVIPTSVKQQSTKWSAWPTKSNAIDGLATSRERYSSCDLLISNWINRSLSSVTLTRKVWTSWLGTLLVHWIGSISIAKQNADSTKEVAPNKMVMAFNNTFRMQFALFNVYFNKKIEELLVPFSPSRQRRADWDRNKVIRVGLD